MTGIERFNLWVSGLCFYGFVVNAIEGDWVWTVVLLVLSLENLRRGMKATCQMCQSNAEVFPSMFDGLVTYDDEEDER